MDNLQTVDDLRAAHRIAEEEIDAAVAAYLADPLPPVFIFGRGYRIDLKKAVRNHPGARVFTAREDVGLLLKRPFVRAAILQARPKAP